MSEKFLHRIEKKKKSIFQKMIEAYEREFKDTNYFNGPSLKISEVGDTFMYVSEDKKGISTSDEFEKNKVFSYLIYFSHYHHIAKYTNGGVKLIGFYDRDLLRVKEIPLKEFKIVGCSTACNFEAKKYPSFKFELKHIDGNKHSSFDVKIFNEQSCQKALDSIWEVENFYSDYYSRLVDSNGL